MTAPATLPIRAYLRMRADTCVAADTTRGMVLTLRASVKTCQLAPLAPSWVKHADKTNSSSSTQGLRLV